ncbi:hypothetical protein FA09DRAFT_327083 [Tilletiopsis washingtonensis]|uniref:Uncharacterized protein n=1 Tax=Tilletiopsis washingtonensis TaxID=58919 RepID=A0A316ZLC5_9BASI|nr:hypothetical protein FA09DRAFT_327083 [Tilletiopsis washingtonensis]PWO01124.1 hypothetical protein FA09DRAFT_327083 [Tilletiopsis washingtonensis]
MRARHHHADRGACEGHLPGCGAHSAMCEHAGSSSSASRLLCDGVRGVACRDLMPPAVGDATADSNAPLRPCPLRPACAAVPSTIAAATRSTRTAAPPYASAAILCPSTSPLSRRLSVSPLDRRDSPEHQVERGLLLDVVVAERAAVLELLAGEDEALLVRRNALLVLDLGLDVVDRVRGLDLERDRLARQSLDEDLHPARPRSVSADAPRNVVIRSDGVLSSLSLPNPVRPLQAPSRGRSLAASSARPSSLLMPFLLDPTCSPVDEVDDNATTPVSPCPFLSRSRRRPAPQRQRAADLRCCDAFAPALHARAAGVPWHVHGRYGVEDECGGVACGAVY